MTLDLFEVYYVLCANYSYFQYRYCVDSVTKFWAQAEYSIKRAPMDLTELLAFKPSSSSKRPHEEDEEIEERPPPNKTARNGASKEGGGGQQLTDQEKLELLMSMEDDDEDDNGERKREHIENNMHINSLPYRLDFYAYVVSSFFSFSRRAGRCRSCQANDPKFRETRVKKSRNAYQISRPAD